jgi:hypothetical protein
LGVGIIKGALAVIGISLVVSICIFAFSDFSDADSNVTVSGAVTVPDAEDCTDAKIDSLIIAFVGDDHTVLSKVTDGQYSVELKANRSYSIRSFNYSNGSNGAVFSGTEMSYLVWKDISVSDSNMSLNIAFEKGTEFTDSDGNKYLLYPSGIATLVELNVEYEKLAEPAAGVLYCVKEGSVLVVPESVHSGNTDYKVTFVGDTVSTYGCVIPRPPSDQSPKAGVFNGATSTTLTIRFEGDVILNYQTFTSPYGNSETGKATGSPYNIHVFFDKDVYVNSLPKVNSSGKFLMSPVKNSLMAVKEVSIGGVYHGAIYVKASTDSYNLHDQTIKDGDLANCQINAITFDKNMDINKADVLNNSTILSMGLLESSTLTVEPITNGYSIKNKATTVVCSSVSNVTNDPITLIIVNGDSVTYSILAKGSVLEDPVAPDGMEFGGWYRDSEYTQAYDSTELLNANTTVYAKYVPKQYSIAISGDGLTVRNGDDAVASGSKIEFDTALTIVVENRIGYTATVKMDGIIVTGGTVKVPAKDFVISCEWVAIDYVVKCMDGETEVKAIQNCHIGDVVTLPAAPAKEDMNFNGWKINGLMLGAQYVVDYRDVGEGDVITLTADYSAVVVDSFWALTVDGEGTQGKVFWTPTNAIGTYGMITVLPGEFEKVTYAVSSNGGYGIISDNCVMVYSNDGKDVTVTVAFQDVGKASEYDVSIAEIASGDKHGFRATVTAENGYVDDAGEFKIRYVYKTWNADENLWIYATSGVTAGVNDEVITIAAGKSSFATGDFLLDKEGATLVFGYASYSFEGTVAGAAGTVTVTSPVIMSVSEIQAVVGRP